MIRRVMHLFSAGSHPQSCPQPCPQSCPQRLVCAAVGLAMGLSAVSCFSPVPSYTKGSLETSALALRHVAVKPIAERQGQILRALLEERLGSGDKKIYKKIRKKHSLSITLSTKTSDRDFGRARIVGEQQATATFALKSTGNKGESTLLQGRVIKRSNYTVRSGFVAEHDAKQEALRHVLALVADEILLRLRLFFFTQTQQDEDVLKVKKAKSKKTDTASSPP